MKRIRKPSAIAHAAKMLWRNKSSYAMLSVTIVLSFSLLLGYLSFMDSDLYNRYKVIFSARKDVVMTYTSDKKPVDHLALANKVRKADETAQMYQYFSINTRMIQYNYVTARLVFIPQGNRPVFEMMFGFDDKYGNIYQLSRQIWPIMGKMDFDLAENECIINESFFRAISSDGTLPVSIVVPVQWNDGTTSYFPLKVVGVCKDASDCNLRFNEYGYPTGNVEIYLSQALMGERTAADFHSTPRRISWISTEKPSEIALYAQQLGMVVHSVADAQEEALISIRAQKATKGIIAIVLLLLLGINLYSSFSNALERRKYEIGVKRAIGASGGSIMGQFLLESMMVMLVNIAASIIIVLDVLVGYKLYVRIVENVTWTVNISIHTILMFLVCSLSLTTAFSLLFAYKSTRVEIVQYLKAE